MDEFWSLGYGGATFSLRDVKGLGYIQRLLRHPGEEFHALDLASEGGAASSTDDGAGADKMALLGEPSVAIARPGDAGEMLDARAKEDYRQRLLELREELEDLRGRGNRERAEEVASEIEFLACEIARAVGLGGHSRRAGSIAERARLNVTRAIKGALRKISGHHAQLGEFLDRSIRTGSYCSYAEHPRGLVSWQFSVAGSGAPGGDDAVPAFFFGRETSFLRSLTERTPFFGREAERASLRRLLELALGGQGGVAMIGGPAGVGKTRIAAEIGVEASRKGALTLVGGCHDRDDSVPFIAFVEILEGALAQAPSLEAFRNSLGKEAAEIARLLPQLRRLFSDIPPALELPPEQSRRVLFTAFAELLVRTSTHRPMMLLLDDLHWADEGTLLLLNHLARLVPKMPVLIVGTYRDFEVDPARGLARTLDEQIRFHLVKRINLSGLTRDEVADMVRGLSGREPPESVVSRFYSLTDGNPFFVEELFRHLVEQGKLTDAGGEFRSEPKLDDINLPLTLRLAIGRRLARLSHESRKILATAAVIGRSFRFDLLQASTATDADSILDRLEEAERIGLISSTLEYPQARFQFSHELIRQALLGDLSPARRQRLHLGVADAIERIYAGTLEDQAADLAHHLWQAGTLAEPNRTIGCLATSARRALAQSACNSALHALQNALELLGKLPDTQERTARAQQELELQASLGMALIFARGYSAPEVQRAYGRARELCSRLGETPRLYPVLWGLWGYYLVRGEYSTSHDIGTQLLALAQRQRDPDLLLEARVSQGLNFVYGGRDLTATRGHLESALSADDREARYDHALVYGQDPRTVARSHLSWVLWFQGYPQQALAMHRECLRFARARAHGYSLAYALATGASFCQFIRNVPRCRELAEEGIALSTEQGFSYFLLAATYSLGWALGQAGKAEAAVETLRGAIDRYQAMGAQATRPHQLGLLADALGRAGRVPDALSVLDQAVAEVRGTQEEYYEAELYRIRGELLLLQIRPDEEAAEAAYLKSLDVARRQAAKSWELRAATSLFRLKGKHAAGEPARQELAAVYNWFTEGFDSPDLDDARALLAQGCEHRQET